MEQQISSFFSRQGLAHAMNIYNFPQDYVSRPKFRTLALRYLFQYRNKDRNCPTVQNLVETAVKMFHELESPANRCEIADIVHTFSPDSSHKLLEHLRRETKTVETKTPGLPPSTSVYEDSQNVHNSKINQTVIKVTETLYNQAENIINLKGVSKEENYSHKNTCLQEIKNFLVNKYPEKSSLLEDSIEYIRSSTASFGTNFLSMTDALLSLWIWIQSQKADVIDELESRLLEELKEMNGLCTTGHLSRLMNVIQGFTEDENLCIRISNIEQCSSVVKKYLTKELMECTDPDVMDGMTSDNVQACQKYIFFLRKKIANKLLEWKKEYGNDMLENIVTIVNGFAGKEIYCN